MVTGRFVGAGNGQAADQSRTDGHRASVIDVVMGWSGCGRFRVPCGPMMLRTPWSSFVLLVALAIDGLDQKVSRTRPPVFDLT